MCGWGLGSKVEMHGFGLGGAGVVLQHRAHDLLLYGKCPRACSRCSMQTSAQGTGQMSAQIAQMECSMQTYMLIWLTQVAAGIGLV